MKLWRISQYVNKSREAYQTAIVAAETKTDARYTNPSNEKLPEPWAWCEPKDVIVELIGSAARGTKKGAIVAKLYESPFRYEIDNENKGQYVASKYLKYDGNVLGLKNYEWEMSSASRDDKERIIKERIAILKYQQTLHVFR